MVNAMTNGKKYVLVVDESLMVAQTVSDMLQNLGINTFIAIARSEVIDQIKIGKAHSLITNFKKEVGSGLSLIREVKEINPNITCILMSGLTPTLTEMATAGVDFYLKKPFCQTTPELIEIVKYFKQNVNQNIDLHFI